MLRGFSFLSTASSDDSKTRWPAISLIHIAVNHRLWRWDSNRRCCYFVIKDKKPWKGGEIIAGGERNEPPVRIKKQSSPGRATDIYILYGEAPVSRPDKGF
jgi:hypothetical protein